jgi:hypothetical protein
MLRRFLEHLDQSVLPHGHQWGGVLRLLRERCCLLQLLGLQLPAINLLA